MAIPLKEDLNGDTTTQGKFKTAIGQLWDWVNEKLDAASYTASDVLAKLKTVDGAGSGLDADLVQGVPKDLLGIGGDGYAWVDETANRTSGVTYTNTYGYPIMVSIQHNYNSTNVSIVVNGVNTSTFYSSGYVYPCVTTIVPAGATYILSNSTVKYWAELK